MSKQYKPHEIAELLNISVVTLQRWDRSGKLIAKRNPSGRRYYTEDQFPELFTSPDNTINARSIVGYTRVSNRNQKDDLENQKLFLQSEISKRGLRVDEIITDIGSGLNYNRPHWNKLIDRVINREISTIFITYKDRFIRFGYDWFEKFCNKFGTQIVVLNEKNTSPQQELVDDLISIIHVFSCRIYGLRKYKQVIQLDSEVLDHEKNDETIL